MTASGIGPTQLSWIAPSDAGGSTTILYDVLRSSSPGDFSGAQCLASGIAATSYNVGGFMSNGYYLVRSRNACGASLGAASNGTPRTGVACPQSDGGACFNNLDCVTTACCNGFCRDLSTNVDNCGACGLMCVVSHGTPACVLGQCEIASCNPGFDDCNVFPGDGCETSTSTDVNNCGACNTPCASFPNANPVCTIGTCSFQCVSGFADCDGQVPNGCECSGNICCSGACAPPHVNGLGQSFDSCAPLGVPGNSGTYSLSLAQAARAAWPFVGVDNAGTCMGGTSALSRQTATSCAVWTYTNATAGYVRLNTANNTCFCPTTSDAPWM